MKSEGRYVAKTENNHVIYVTDFGADPSGKTDSTEAVIRALEQAKKFRQQDLEKGITLDFPKGVYHFYPDLGGRKGAVCFQYRRSRSGV